MQSIHGVKYRFGRSTPLNSLQGNGTSGASFAADAGTLFNSNARGNTDTRPTNSVSVENIPAHINKREILALFSTLIGEIRSFHEIRDSVCPRLDITFVDRDAAAKAMCMNGYTVDGTPLSLSILTNIPSHRGNKAPVDDRRNLYVLGLPFALSKAEFAALFSPYGTVSHCVILATVDNSSRRRGFVVMSSHEEARRAMAALTRTQTKGHAIDVSWAVVQRSQGFLDGGDRAMLLDSRSNMPSPVPFEKRQFGSTSDSSDSSEGHDADPASLTTSFMPTSSLLVTNLPTLLFSQVQDLHPLFFPFGPIDKLEIVQVSPMGTMSVLVQYSRASVAQEARDNLSGQVYGTHQIEARFVRLTTLALPGFERNSPANDMISVDNFTRHTSVGSFAPGSLTRTSSFNQERVNGGPFIVKVSPLLNSFGFPNLGISDDASMNHSRQSSFSAKQSPFSNVFDDHRDPAQMSAHLGWGLNYGHASGHQRQFPLSTQMHCHAVYQSSAA